MSTNEKMREKLEEICLMQRKYYGDGITTHLELARLADEARTLLSTTTQFQDEPAQAQEPVASIHKDTLAMLMSDSQAKDVRVRRAHEVKFDTNYVSLYTSPPPAQQEAAGALGELAMDSGLRMLLRRVTAQLLAWHEKYGKHNPRWLPPAGDVKVIEDVEAFLEAHPAITSEKLTSAHPFALSAKKVAAFAESLLGYCMLADMENVLPAEIDGSILDHLGRALAEYGEIERYLINTSIPSPAPLQAPPQDGIRINATQINVLLAAAEALDDLGAPVNAADIRMIVGEAAPQAAVPMLTNDEAEALRMVEQVIPFRLDRIAKDECVDTSIDSIRFALGAIKTALLSRTAAVPMERKAFDDSAVERFWNAYNEATAFKDMIDSTKIALCAALDSPVAVSDEDIYALAVKHGFGWSGLVDGYTVHKDDLLAFARALSRTAPGVVEGFVNQPQPPCTNEFVADGCERFPDEPQ